MYIYIYLEIEGYTAQGLGLRCRVLGLGVCVYIYIEIEGYTAQGLGFSDSVTRKRESQGLRFGGGVLQNQGP